MRMRGTVVTAALLLVALVAALGFAPGERDFDIAVSGLEVLATQNHSPTASPVAIGQPGQEYYLLCGFTPTGSGGPSSVQFRFLVNGQVIRDVQAPVKPGQFVGMGEFWTPSAAGTYTLVCEANPNKTFPETTYGNNHRTKQFSVKDPQLDTSAVTKLQILKPSQAGKVSADMVKEFAMLPDIKVHGLWIHSVSENGTPLGIVQKGFVGRTYYLYCVMETFGQLATSGVLYHIKSSGEILANYYIPLESGGPFELGVEWTPQTAGSYQLVCEANPEKTVPEATFENNLRSALFPVQLTVSPQPAMQAGPVRVPSEAPGKGEKETDEKSLLLCPECFNPQPEPPGKIREEEPPFHPDPPPPTEMPSPISNPSPQPPPQDRGLEPDAVKEAAAPRAPLSLGTPSAERLPDLVPELALPGGGVLFPLHLLVMNEGTAASPPSRVRVTWHLNCHSADGSSSMSFPVGPQDKVYSVPTIAPQQSYNVPGLSGPSQYCEAPPAAVRAGLSCAKHCYVRALADADAVVIESDEVNNAASVEVKRK